MKRFTIIRYKGANGESGFAVLGSLGPVDHPVFWSVVAFDPQKQRSLRMNELSDIEFILDISLCMHVRPSLTWRLVEGLPENLDQLRALRLTLQL